MNVQDPVVPRFLCGKGSLFLQPEIIHQVAQSSVGQYLLGLEVELLPVDGDLEVVVAVIGPFVGLVAVGAGGVIGDVDLVPFLVLVVVQCGGLASATRLLQASFYQRLTSAPRVVAFTAPTAPRHLHAVHGSEPPGTPAAARRKPCRPR